MAMAQSEPAVVLRETSAPGGFHSVIRRQRRSPTHSQFECGNEALDRWLVRHAW